MGTATRRAVALASGLLFLVGAVDAATSTADRKAAAESCLEAQGYTTSQLEQLPSGAFLVDAVLDSTKMKLVVDNKSARTFLDLSRVKKLGYEVEPTTTELSIGTRREPVYRLKDANLKVGTTDMGPLDVSLTKVEYFTRAAGVDSDMDVGGVLGADLLKRCGSVVDFGTNQLFLKPPPVKKAETDTTTAEKKRPLFGEVEERLKRIDGGK